MEMTVRQVLRYRVPGSGPGAGPVHVLFIRITHPDRDTQNERKATQNNARQRRTMQGNARKTSNTKAANITPTNRQPTTDQSSLPTARTASHASKGSRVQRTLPTPAGLRHAVDGFDHLQYLLATVSSDGGMARRRMAIHDFAFLELTLQVRCADEVPTARCSKYARRSARGPGTRVVASTVTSIRPRIHTSRRLLGSARRSCVAKPGT